MSDEALQNYDLAFTEQQTRNQARNILRNVSQARLESHPAAFRWPFELLQNALDTGPRTGRSTVEVHFRYNSSKLVFEHDGKPFSLKDLAALLSGGSNKEFESDDQTGRFGTGFLVTHVLAERMDLKGLLELASGCEQFALALDRSGDEGKILENINSCRAAIHLAQRVSDFGSVPSASFQYPIDDNSTLLLGFSELHRALPYLYATRPVLGRIEIAIETDKTELWLPSEVIQEDLSDGYLEYRSVRVIRDGETPRDFNAYRFMLELDAKSSAIVLVELTGGCNIQIPGQNTPRVYRQYPLRGSSFVPLNFIIDGNFKPDEKREKVLMSDLDRKLLKDAFASAVLAVRHAFDQKWEGAHLLAKVGKPKSAFDPDNDEERLWWTQRLTELAERMAKLPIVKCSSGAFPAILQEQEAENSDETRWYSDFIIPNLLGGSFEEETTVQKMWPLVEAATQLLPPSSELAADWTEIAEGWADLGLEELGLISLKTLGEYVREDAKTLNDLRVGGDLKEWLAKFLDLVGECWKNRNGVELSVLAGMLPNQNLRLCSPGELRRDVGIPDELKDICSDLGMDIRETLLSNYFDELSATAEFQFLLGTISKAVPEAVSEDQVILDAVKYLQSKFPEDEDCDEQTTEMQKVSVRLLSYIWKSQGTAGASVSRTIPLITLEKRSVRWSRERIMMAPVSTWHGSAQPFFNAYPPHRVLDDLYAGDEDQNIPNVVAALVKWGIAIEDPITSNEPAELKGRRLSAISSSDAKDVIVSQATFSQIALLQPEVLNRCQEGIEEASALLGLVLCYVAPNDPEWRIERLIKGRRSGEDVDVLVRGALWLADLKFRAWVPVPDGEGKFGKMQANPSTLEKLLDPQWLVNNDAAIKLLSECFGFDELDLRLLGIAPEEVKRQELRNGLAKLLEFGGSDPALYLSLAEQIQEEQRRNRDINFCMQFGLAVQEAIKSAVENYRIMRLELIDRGFDYEATVKADDIIGDAATKYMIGPYLLEVKATTSGEVRLTSMQAKTASENTSNYVLCVVDLRNLSEEEIDGEWTASRVEPLAKIVTDIGARVEETYSWIDAARANPIAIRNDSALRYGIPVSIWEAGISISEWIAGISKLLSVPNH